MKECIAVINQKGGVGKSTTAFALGAGLILKGYKVLFIDLDAQGNLSYNMNSQNKAITSLEVLTGTATAQEAIVGTATGDLIPASPALASADALITATGKEYRLKEAIEALKASYDYIILDTPPALGILTVNALTACNSVIIPAQADTFSLQGIGQLSQTIQAVKKYCNPTLSIKGIVVTRYNSRAVLTRDMTELLDDTARQLNTKLYKTKIRECIAIKEAQASQQDIYSYSPKSNATADYTNLVEEILEKEK
ncbi:MAG: ParA family protein [Eubacteriales bacterium]